MSSSVLEKIIRIVNYIAITLLALIFMFPLYWMVVTAFKEMHEVVSMPPVFFPANPSFSSFRRVIGEFGFMRSFYVSAVVSLTVTVFSVFNAALAGFAFAKYEFKGQRILFILVLATMMIPFQVIMIPLYVMIVNLNWHDSFAGLIVPSLISGFGIFLMRQFMDSLPGDLFDAGRIDGCSGFRLFWQIALPNVKPALSALCIFQFMFQWNSFFWPFLIINETRMRPVSLALALYQNQFTGPQYNLVMAANLIVIAPTLILFLCLQRNFVQGIALTGMKA